MSMKEYARISGARKFLISDKLQTPQKLRKNDSGKRDTPGVQKFDTGLDEISIKDTNQQIQFDLKQTK